MAIYLGFNDFLHEVARHMERLQPSLSSEHEEKQQFFLKVAGEEIRNWIKDGGAMNTATADIVAAKAVSRAHREWAIAHGEMEESKDE